MRNIRVCPESGRTLNCHSCVLDAWDNFIIFAREAVEKASF